MTSESADKTRAFLYSSFEVATRIAMPFLIGVAGWTFTNILDHEKRLTRIEATQFTQGDGRALEQRTNETLQSINEKLSDLKETAAVRDAQMHSMNETVVKIREFIVSREGARTLDGRVP